MIEALYTVGDIACPKCLAEGSVYIPKPNTYMCTICKVDMVDFLVNDADQDEYDFLKVFYLEKKKKIMKIGIEFEFIPKERSVVHFRESLPYKGLTKVEGLKDMYIGER